MASRLDNEKFNPYMEKYLVNSYPSVVEKDKEQKRNGILSHRKNGTQKT